MKFVTYVLTMIVFSPVIILGLLFVPFVCWLLGANYIEEMKDLFKDMQKELSYKSIQKKLNKESV